MYYTYILQSHKDSGFYTGFSEDLRKRVEAHKAGKVAATKYRLPIQLIFYEAYLNKYDALRREQYFKTSKGKSTLRAMLKETLAG
jgi:putative endonuclease